MHEQYNETDQKPDLVDGLIALEIAIAQHARAQQRREREDETPIEVSEVLQ